MASPTLEVSNESSDNVSPVPSSTLSLRGHDVPNLGRPRQEKVSSGLSDQRFASHHTVPGPFAQRIAFEGLHAFLASESRHPDPIDRAQAPRFSRI